MVEGVQQGPVLVGTFFTLHRGGPVTIQPWYLGKDPTLPQ